MDPDEPPTGLRDPFTWQQALTRFTPGEVRHQVRSGRWQRPFHGVYVAADRPLDLRLRASAACLAAGSRAVVGLTTAAELHGFGVLRDDLVRLVVPRGIDGLNQPGLRVTTAALTPADIATIGGIRCTTAARTAIDLARTRSRPDGLAVLDAALRAAKVTRADLDVELAAHAGLRHVRRARELVGPADARAESPMESRLRLAVHDAGLPEPVPQLWVRDPYGQPRYRLDLGWEANLVGAEYDGDGHRDHTQLQRDRARHNWLATRGWQLVYFTDLDVYHRQHRIGEVLRWALSSPRTPLGDHRDFVAKSGRPGESHPEAPTERNVTVSRHSALLIAVRRMCAPMASV